MKTHLSEWLSHMSLMATFLPLDSAGLGLVVLGLGLLVAEMFLPTFGALGIGGIIVFSTGALMLVNSGVPAFGMPLSFVTGFAIVAALFVFGVSSVALKARKRPVVSGSEAMPGSIGVMLDATGAAPASGWARVHGERWRVQTASSRELPGEGALVRVLSRHGLTLMVEALERDRQSHQH
ncbi:hypothetical protein YK56LOC_08970 [Caballeronia sp. HLA56]